MSDATGNYAESMYIQQICLQHFMCHTNFELELCPQMNIIYGTNGSGKSTILTALMVGLGSRTKQTSRGNKIGELVRRGQRKAWISIKFFIPVCYSKMHTKYGDSVTIERQIDVNGTSNVKLIDHNGKTVKDSKSADITEICRACGIFSSNELAMLSQENAKEFLSHATPAQKYKKLREGLSQILIEQYREQMEEQETQREEIRQRIKRRRDQLEHLDERNKELLRRNHQLLKSQKELREVKRVLAWKDYDDVAKLVEKANREVAEAESEIAAFTSQAEPELLLQQLNEAIHILEEEKATTLKKLKEVSTALELVEEDHNNREYDVKQAASDYAAEKEVIAGFQAEIDELGATIDQKDPAALESERRWLEGKLDSTRSAIIKIEESIEHVSEKLNKSKERLKDEDQQAKSVKNELMAVIGDIRETQHELEILTAPSSANSNSDQKGASAQFARLKKLVDAEQGWHQKPIGPLYDYIEINDEGSAFLPAIERLWNSTLESWWVIDRHDSAKLNDLARRARLKAPQTLIRRDDPFDFHESLPDTSEHYSRVADVLSIKHDAILRILVDLNRIESQILLKDMNYGFKAVRNVRNASSALIQGVSKQGDTRFTQITHYSSTDSSSIKNWDRAFRIQVSKEARKRLTTSRIDSLKRRKTKLESTLESKMHSRDEAKHDVESSQQMVNDARAQLAELSQTMKLLTNKLSEIRNRRPDNETRDEIEDLKRKLNENQNYVNELQESMLGLDGAERKTWAHLNKTRQRVAKREDKLKEVNEELAIKNQERTKCIREQQNATQRKQFYEQNLIDKQNHQRLCFLECEDTKKRLVDTAGELDRSNPLVKELLPLSSNELIRKKQYLEEVSNISQVTKDKIERAEREINENELEKTRIKRDSDEFELLDNAIKDRNLEWESNENNLWNGCVERIQEEFKKILSLRRFGGEVIIDDERRILETTAGPDSQSNRSSTTLSGGEKSFVQVALLMAVWNSMNVGLTALDEYDVYMDKLNRSESLQALARSVKEKRMQCILITPQDVDTSVINGIVPHVLHTLRSTR